MPVSDRMFCIDSFVILLNSGTTIISLECGIVGNLLRTIIWLADVASSQFPNFPFAFFVSVFNLFTTTKRESIEGPILFICFKDQSTCYRSSKWDSSIGDDSLGWTTTRVRGNPRVSFYESGLLQVVLKGRIDCSSNGIENSPVGNGNRAPSDRIKEQTREERQRLLVRPSKVENSRRLSESSNPKIRHTKPKFIQILVIHFLRTVSPTLIRRVNICGDGVFIPRVGA